MSVVVSAVSSGLNAEMDEAVTGGVMPDDQLPDGCELHIGGPVDEGWRVITVWESREVFDRFREERLLPAIRGLAGDEPPPTVEPKVNPVHKLVTRSSVVAGSQRWLPRCERARGDRLVTPRSSAERHVVGEPFAPEAITPRAVSDSNSLLTLARERGLLACA